MPDNLHYPAESRSYTSYRSQRGSDTGMRMMTIAAAALGGLLVLGMGGWAMLGRRPAVVPVIQADSRPLRVKPTDAGGMQVAGANEAVMGGAGSGVERMAPAVEAPAPEALRAQMQQAPAPKPAAPAPPPAAPAAVAGSPLPDTAPPPAKPVPAEPARPAATGRTMVQLASLTSEASAQSEWERLTRRMPELLSDRKLSVQKTEHEGRTYWRVRTGGFGDAGEAAGFCTKVKARGGDCAVAAF